MVDNLRTILDLLVLDLIKPRNQESIITELLGNELSELSIQLLQSLLMEEYCNPGVSPEFAKKKRKKRKRSP